MSYAQNIWLFSALVFGIIAVPGMDMFYVVTSALTGGRARGLAATAGVMLGGAVHAAFATVFVGVLSGISPLAFQVLMLAGAGYMAWIGWTLIGSTITVSDMGEASAGSHRRAFAQGLMTCLLNPKAYMFTLAVFPQFMLAKWGAVWVQAIVMGAIIVAMQAAIYGTLALLAAKSRDFLTTSPAFTIWFGRGAGALFLAVAALTLARLAMGGL